MEASTQTLFNTFGYTINDYATSILNKTEGAIKQMFPKAILLRTDCLNQEHNTSDIFLEVQIEGATISCTFNSKTNVCDFLHIFFDDDKNLCDLIRVCNLVYSYDLNKSWWYSDQFIVCLKKDQKDIAIAFAAR